MTYNLLMENMTVFIQQSFYGLQIESFSHLNQKREREIHEGKRRKEYSLMLLTIIEGK